jgi:hypothetical protein
LGYKEQGGEYTYSKYKMRYIKVNYSIINKIKYLGYKSKFLSVEKKIDELKLQKLNDQHVIKNILNDIYRNRIDNLKKIIYDIQRIIYRIKYGYEAKTLVYVEHESAYVDIVEKYKSKITKFVTRDVKNKQKMFKNWDVVKYDMVFKKLTKETINIDINSKWISIDDINLYDVVGNSIMYYIIEELVKLLSYNNNKFIKTNIAYMIIDIINEEHRLFNIDNRTTTFDLKRFGYYLNSHTYMYDSEDKGHGLKGVTEGFYEELVEESIDAKTEKQNKKQRDDDIEEASAFDIDNDNDNPNDTDNAIDYEIDYMAGINVDVNQNPNI